VKVAGANAGDRGFNPGLLVSVKILLAAALKPFHFVDGECARLRRDGSRTRP
jgi:hypothetical protein